MVNRVADPLSHSHKTGLLIIICLTPLCLKFKYLVEIKRSLKTITNIDCNESQTPESITDIIKLKKGCLINLNMNDPFLFWPNCHNVYVLSSIPLRHISDLMIF